MKLKNVETKYIAVAHCHPVKCLCGETYIRHQIDKELACSIDDVLMEDTGFRVNVDREFEGRIVHIIMQCPVCGGLDTNHWSQRAEILKAFNSGHKEYTIYNR